MLSVACAEVGDDSGQGDCVRCVERVVGAAVVEGHGRRLAGRPRPHDDVATVWEVEDSDAPERLDGLLPLLPPSVSAVARRAGLGNATLYRHFPTRSDLIVAVCADEVVTLCAHGAHLRETLPPADALFEWVRAFVAHVRPAAGQGDAVVGQDDGAAYLPAGNSWRLLPLPPVPINAPAGTDPTGSIDSAWTGAQLVVWNVASNEAIAYDPTHDEWDHLPRPPLEGDRGVLRSNGTHLYAIGAPSVTHPARVPLALAQWSDDDQTWQALPEIEQGTETLNIGARPDLTAWAGNTLLYAVWTGAEVLNWGDTCCYGTGGRPFTARAWRYTPPELNKRQPTTLEAARARSRDTNRDHPKR